MSPLALADDFGVDPLRYHLLRDVPLGGDGDFSYEGIVARYNADLANNLGNLVSRVTTVVTSKCGGVGPGCNPASELACGGGRRAGRGDGRPGRAGRRTRRSRRRGGSSAPPTRSSRRPSPGRWSPARPSTPCSATRSRSCASWPILIAPAMPSTAVEVWRRIGLAGDPSTARAARRRRVGWLRRRRGRREGGAPLPAAQGLTVAGWFDSHCHVQEEYLPGDDAGAADLEPVLSPGGRGRHRPAGLHRDRRRHLGAGGGGGAVDGRAGTAPRAWASIGLHPHEASEGVDEVAALLARELAADDGAVVAVGECGLDYYYEHSPRDAQRAAFAAQIALAHAHDLALVIHARDAWADLFDVLDAEGVPERTVLHCFTGGPEEVERCLRAGMYVSFSGIVTFKNAADVGRRRRAVRSTVCSSKRTARSSHRCRIAVARTSRRTFRWSATRSPR